jgi:hypothetical protein
MPKLLATCIYKCEDTVCGITVGIQFKMLSTGRENIAGFLGNLQRYLPTSRGKTYLGVNICGGKM